MTEKNAMLLSDQSKTEYPPPPAREIREEMLAAGMLESLITKSTMLFSSVLACIPHLDPVSNRAGWP